MDVRLATWEDEPRICAFLKQFYAERFPTKYPERWHWQYASNPYAPRGHLPILIATEDSRVVGQLGLQWSPLWSEGHLYTCAWGVDFGVLPEFRGKGLGGLLQKRAAEQASFFCSASMDAKASRIKARLGFLKGCETFVWIRFSGISSADVREYLQGKALSLGRIGSAGIQVFDHLPGAAGIAAYVLGLTARRRGKTDAVKDLTLEQIESFGEDITSLWDKNKDNYSMTTARTAEFLNWRYVRCPQLSYLKYRAILSGDTVGYIVLRQRIFRKNRSLRVVDFLCHQKDETIFTALLEGAIEKCGWGTPAVEIACSGVHYNSALRRNGFLRVKTCTPLAAGKGFGDGGNLSAVDDWFITFGDQDWDQLRAGEVLEEAITTAT